MSKDCSKPQVCKRCGEEGHMVRECSQEEKTRQMTDEEGKVKILIKCDSFFSLKSFSCLDPGDLRAKGRNR